MTIIAGRYKVPAIGSAWLYREGEKVEALSVVRADSWTGEVLLRRIWLLCVDGAGDFVYERPSGVSGTGKEARPISLAQRVTDKMTKADKELKSGDLLVNAAWSIWDLMTPVDPTTLPFDQHGALPFNRSDLFDAGSTPVPS